MRVFYSTQRHFRVFILGTPEGWQVSIYDLQKHEWAETGRVEDMLRTAKVGTRKDFATTRQEGSRVEMALVAWRNGHSATTEFVQHASDDTLERYAVKTLTDPIVEGADVQRLVTGGRVDHD
jgi:hypothetical protein